MDPLEPRPVAGCDPGASVAPPFGRDVRGRGHRTGPRSRSRWARSLRRPPRPAAGRRSFVVFGDACPAIRYALIRASILDHDALDLRRARPRPPSGRRASSPSATRARRSAARAPRGRPRRRTPRAPPRPGGAPARSDACRPSRAAAATSARPAGSSPGAASPPPRSPARS